jgi:hypothetical protein
MPIVRILMLLVALASSALAQDGARDAAAARAAAQAFRAYVDGGRKRAGGPTSPGRRSPRCSAASSISAP